MKLIIGADHKGFKLKNEIIKELENQYEFVDYSSELYDELDDYPLIAKKICNNILNDDLGIAICGSGIGISIACNKIKGIRCAKVNSNNDVFLAKKDNNANVIAFSGDTSLIDVKQWLKTFVETKYENSEKYNRRLEQISSLEG